MDEEYKPIYQIEEDKKKDRIKRIMQRRKEWDAKKGIMTTKEEPKKVVPNNEFPSFNFPTLGEQTVPVVKGAWGSKKLQLS
jgi:hypothetical protein